MAPNDPFKCTFKQCPKRFPDREALRRHKVDDPEHDYCEMCDVDCEDWEAFVKHKTLSEKHISCPVCGSDFKSRGGLKKHIEQFHRKDQNLVCPGCDSKFTRAAALAGHLEEGNCDDQTGQGRSITSRDFHDRTTQKRALKKLLDRRDDGSTWNSSYVPTTGTRSAVSRRSDSHSHGSDSVAGGIALLDERISENESSRLSEPLSPQSEHRRLQTDGPNLGALSIKEFDEEADSFPKLGDGISGVKKPLQTSVVGAPMGAWSQADITSKMFSDSKGHNRDTKFIFSEGIKAINKEYETETKQTRKDSQMPSLQSVLPGEEAAGKGNNMFYTKFWDPNSGRFNPENFFDERSGRYVCPHLECGFHCQVPIDMSDHLQEAQHRQARITCPSCKRRFRSHAAIVAHMESSTVSCKIKNNPNYEKILSDLTGGYIEVERPTINPVSDSISVAGNSAWDDDEEEDAGPDGLSVGINKIRYTAKRPENFW